MTPIAPTPWTPEEDNILRTKLHEGVEQKAIAILLGRSVPSVKWRRKLLLLGSLPKSGSRPWTAKETEVARKLLRENASDATIRATIGRTKFACYDRLKRLGQPFTAPVRPQITIPDHVLEDRNRRYMVARDLTAVLMGDPEPNRVRL